MMMKKSSGAALTVDDLCVTLAQHEILQHLSISFPAGRRTAIIGPNGAGKTTLLRAIAGFNTHYTGCIRLDGHDVRDMKPRQLARRMAILPQGATAPPDITVQSLVEYGRFPYRSYFRAGDAQADREAVTWAMQVTHVDSFAGRQVQTLSGGERQRVFLAMALAQQPEILLLDEPTSYLDIAHQLEVMNIVTEINADYGITVIMVLHDINHAMQYADEAAVVHQHHIYAQGRPEEVLNEQLLADVFGVRAERFVNSRGIVILSPVELVR